MMIHHFGILQPPEGKAINGRKPFFGGAASREREDGLSRLERDFALLGLGWTGLDTDRAAEERPRFVRLVMPPYL